MKDFIFDYIVKHSEGNLYWKDTKSVYCGCNDNFVKSANLKNEKEIIGKTDFDLLKGYLEIEEINKIVESDKQVIETKKPILKEEVAIGFNNKECVYLSKKAPIIKDNEVIGIFGISIDITDKKNAEKFELEKNVAEQKAHFSKVAAGSIAHDLRTPLASINAGMMGIAYFLEPLLKTYDIAKEAGLEIPLINKNKLNALSKVIDNCNNEIAFSHDFINQTLNNLQHDSIDTSGYKKYNIKTVLESALESYPYQGNERELLHTDLAVDFDFFGSDVYLKNMFNNLLKNSFYYIAAARRGEIYITTLENEDNFILQFKDTAQGAPSDVVEHMFDGYFSKRSGGTGLGLAFCKTVMESFNGFISAKSIEGEFIEFTLLFPKPPNH